MAIANNTIEYTTTDGKAISFLLAGESTFFGVNGKSNTYTNGKGVITFESSVTSVGSANYLNRIFGFYNCTTLKTITLPDTVTAITDNAFYGCSNLTEINIPKNVKTMTSTNFSGCTSLTTILYDAKSLDAPTATNTTPFYCIKSQITSFIIGDSVEIIPSYLCASLTKLPSIIFPNRAISIEFSAFAECNSLTSITIPEKINPSGVRCFQFCSNLASATIESKDIGDEMFYMCKRLSVVYVKYNKGVVNLGIGTFDNCNSLKKIWVPFNFVEAYKSDSKWSEYKDKIYDIKYGNEIATQKEAYDISVNYGEEGNFNIPHIVCSSVDRDWMHGMEFGFNNIASFTYQNKTVYEWINDETEDTYIYTLKGLSDLKNGDVSIELYYGADPTGQVTASNSDFKVRGYGNYINMNPKQCTTKKFALAVGCSIKNPSHYNSDKRLVRYVDLVKNDVSVFNVTLNQSSNGIIYVNGGSGSTTASVGDTLTLTSKANDGYTLDSYSVKKAIDSSTISVSDSTFTMPASNVTVSGTFKKKDSGGSSGGGGGGGGDTPTYDRGFFVDFYTDEGDVFPDIFNMEDPNVYNIEECLTGTDGQIVSDGTTISSDYASNAFGSRVFVNGIGPDQRFSEYRKFINSNMKDSSKYNLLTSIVMSQEQSYNLGFIDLSDVERNLYDYMKVFGFEIAHPKNLIILGENYPYENCSVDSEVTPLGFSGYTENDFYYFSETPMRRPSFIGYRHQIFGVSNSPWQDLSFSSSVINNSAITIYPVTYDTSFEKPIGCACSVNNFGYWFLKDADTAVTSGMSLDVCDYMPFKTAPYINDNGELYWTGPVEWNCYGYYGKNDERLGFKSVFKYGPYSAIGKDILTHNPESLNSLGDLLGGIKTMKNEKGGNFFEPFFGTDTLGNEAIIFPIGGDAVVTPEMLDANIDNNAVGWRFFLMRYDCDSAGRYSLASYTFDDWACYQKGDLEIFRDTLESDIVSPFSSASVTDKPIITTYSDGTAGEVGTYGTSRCITNGDRINLEADDKYLLFRDKNMRNFGEIRNSINEVINGEIDPLSRWSLYLTPKYHNADTAVMNSSNDILYCYRWDFNADFSKMRFHWCWKHEPTEFLFD